MREPLRKKMAINGIAALLTVVFLVSMIAVPAVASVVINSVNSASIVDRSIKAVDIGTGAVKTWKLGKGAVTSAKIRDGQVRSADIGKTAISKGHIATGAINSYKILDGTIKNADISNSAAIAASKINRTGLSADLLDGKHATAFATSGHDHDSAYSALAHDHDSDYYTQDEVDSIVAGLSHDHETTKTAYIAIHPSGLDQGAGFPGHGGSAPPKRRNGYVYSGNVGSYNWNDWQAPVQLPDGAIIKSVSFQFLDREAANDSYGELYRWGTAAEVVASIDSSGTSSTAWQEFETSSITDPLVDNSKYSYFIRIQVFAAIEENQQVGTIRIKYEYAVH